MVFTKVLFSSSLTDDYLSYACRMLCDYLQEDIAQEISSIYV